jgi:von Willebrand factor type A domain
MTSKRASGKRFGRIAAAAMGLATASAWITACSGDDPAGTGTTTAGSGTGGGLGLTTSSSTQSTGTLSPDAACATSVVEGTTVPATMYIMFDKSGSMLENQKWAGAKASLIAFFQDQDSTGLKVALRFFPDDDPVPGCNEVACDVDSCATPLVDVGVLTSEPAVADPQQAALVDAVNSRNPSGQTPMYAALAGAEQWAKAYAAQIAGAERTIVILVTDGEPNGCVEDINAIAALAKDAHDTQGVVTYAVGLEGSNEAQINEIAQAGGSDEGFFIGSGSAQSDLLEALRKIKKNQIACTFAVPESETPGEIVDPNYVNINYIPGGGDAVTLGKVANAGACGAAGGWYYDDDVNPTSISLCPTTCDEAQLDPDARVQVLLGCQTQVQ